MVKLGRKIEKHEEKKIGNFYSFCEICVHAYLGPKKYFLQCFACDISPVSPDSSLSLGRQMNAVFALRPVSLNYANGRTIRVSLY